MQQSASFSTDPTLNVAPVLLASDQDLIATASVTARLNQVAGSQCSVQKLIAAIAAMQNERSSVLGCLTLNRDQHGKLKIASADCKKSDAQIDFDEINNSLLPQLEQILSQDLPVMAAIGDKPYECLSVPVKADDVAVLITVLRTPLTAQQRNLELAIAQVYSNFVGGYQSRETASSVASQMNVAAATLELVLRISDSPTVRLACQQIVVDLKEHFRCDQVFIGTTYGGKTCKVVASSEAGTFDPNSEAMQAAKAVMDESVGRESVGTWPPLPGVDVHQLLAHKAFARRDNFVASTPLNSSAGKPVGALIIVGSRELASVPNIQNFVGSFSEPLGTSLHGIRRREGGRIRRVVRVITAPKHVAKRWIAFLASIIVAVILMVPWEYTINCSSIIEPVERRFCVAPHDGLLETTLARPGDVVRVGQKLAEMDGREIVWELAGVTAEKSRAAKKRDTYLAKQETAEALMADLEFKRLQNEESLLQFKESNLQMTSPIEGIILAGSLDRRENYPVSKGQVLYEIAPIDQVQIECSVPAEEVMHVAVGDEVSVFFEGFGLDAVAGTITRIHPRAEIRESENIFVADVLIDNSERKLRPGMKGVAKIKTESRRVGWIVFHHAAERFRAAMPW